MAQHNGDHGFASMAGALLAAGAGCSAHSNKGAGFTAQASGKLTALEGCQAIANSAGGFSAAGNRALLAYEHDCVAFCNGSNLKKGGDWVEADGGAVVGIRQLSRFQKGL
jgi:hypothetical protein